MIRLFSCFFELWAILGPKCLQGLRPEPPEPPQASLFTDFWELVEQISTLFRHPKGQRASKKKSEKRPAFRFVFEDFLVTKLQAQYRIVTEPCGPLLTGMGTVAGRPKAIGYSPEAH